MACQRPETLTDHALLPGNTAMAAKGRKKQSRDMSLKFISYNTSSLE